ncbi:peptidase M20 [Xanthomonas citri pv. fuscans]|uniref:Peptidase M20 n=1 Tax=Xanthomonas citri pv. fuscans TaxID=366649 RepID=A0AB34QAA6_XANCI|nr:MULTISPECIES: M28 family metallopeptidase [Xanthomonas]ATS64919.1 M28 family peptidase [Xanthomonas citri pv. phaseoli var. fuscans]ATS66690.1 M28 family peptidase [Xanthomonas citri pv. phaseoli var. fuscans]ATS73765.1 M28 family peptidase [Xanthomonas citri pv. phaseoli var. fuscans]ATS76602.1 M28 family peptidase [Xanthomonas citri pv. phaseoli var. fuscans]ATS79025.1 M28 family peptidase [Xanthomonas citri pv. phaseoli var. fuscans]
MKRVAVGLLAMAVSTALMAAAPSFDGARISRDVKELASDAYEGRGPATAGEEKTIAYLSKQFAEAGLQPGGDLANGKRAWTQAVPLRRADIVGTPTIAVQSAGQPQTLTQGKQIAIRAALDGSSTVEIANAPLVFVGYGVKAPERNWDDFKGVDLKGKIAVVLINDPDFETGKGDFDGTGMTYYGRWTYKYEEGARQGALGVLVVHETAPASYGWDTVASSNTNTMFDVVRDNPRSAHPTLEGWIQRDLATELFKHAGLDFETLKKQAQTRGFKPVELKDQRLSASYQVKSDVITSHNVVARLEGSKHPNETLIYSAHWDHIGVGKPDARGDTIFNGALDNASGTAALLELARGFAKGPTPERSVVFLAVTAEEKGLLGSEFYASKPLYPLDTTVAVINMDGMNPFVPSRDFGIYGAAKLELLDQLKSVAAQSKLRYTPDPKPQAGYFFRSDHFSFAKRGVPALSYAAGQDWEVGGVAAGKAAADDYTAKRYHQQGDEWKPDWTFAGAARDLGVLYALGQQLADSRQWPNWSQDSQFRATRDASAAARK